MEPHFGNPSGKLSNDMAGLSVSKFSSDPKSLADLFLKKVLARMDANREASKLANDLAHVCNLSAAEAARDREGNKKP